MKITFACPHCGQSFAVDEKLAGRRARCRACGQPIQIPATAAAADDADAALAEAAAMERQAPVMEAPAALLQTAPPTAAPRPAAGSTGGGSRGLALGPKARMWAAVALVVVAAGVAAAIFLLRGSGEDDRFTPNRTSLDGQPLPKLKLHAATWLGRQLPPDLEAVPLTAKVVPQPGGARELRLTMRSQSYAMPLPADVPKRDTEGRVFDQRIAVQLPGDQPCWFGLSVIPRRDFASARPPVARRKDLKDPHDNPPGWPAGATGLLVSGDADRCERTIDGIPFVCAEGVGDEENGLRTRRMYWVAYDRQVVIVFDTCCRADDKAGAEALRQRMTALRRLPGGP